jgi:hypothetical protein
MVGNVYGFLTVLKLSKNPWRIEAQCICGKVKEYFACNIRRIKKPSCGCKRLQAVTKHGKSYTVEWNTWSKMKCRCYKRQDRNYSIYGGRGIKVCERWLESFENFYADMGPRPSRKHSIERIDVNKDYCPENCKWATYTEQARNKRNTKRVNFKGKAEKFVVLCEKYNMDYDLAHYRLKSGWSVEDAILIPAGKSGTNQFIRK